MRNPKYMKLIEEIVAIHESKNADYATTEDPLSNFRECERIQCPYCHMPIPAWIGALVRLSDKYTRTLNLTAKNPDVKEESIVDTFTDRAVYNLLTRLLYEEWLPKFKLWKLTNEILITQKELTLQEEMKLDQ